MYYRIIVKQNDQFFFRTSRLHSDASMVKALQGMIAAFPVSDNYSVDVLKVTGQPEGKVMSDAEVTETIAMTFAAEEDASENAQPL
jgi:hypothetical protein